MDDLICFIRERFEALADPDKAGPMAAYMKTDMPFYGIQKPQRVPVYREMVRRFALTSRRQYEDAVMALWKQPHREEKYAAIHLAVSWPDFITSASIPLYRRLIRQGAWWDLVDDVAIRLVGKVLLDERMKTAPVMDKWVEDQDMWIRRTAIISQILHKDQTDARRLFDYCRRRVDEKEFFIRKAIGWALREYSYSDPSAVREFLISNQCQLSGLSFREGAKALVRRGLMEK